jgi:hypothetical protein
VIIGFLLYIIPGILVLVFWKPVESCALMFDERDGVTTITAQVKGKGQGGIGFFNQVVGLLL